MMAHRLGGGAETTDILTINVKSWRFLLNVGIRSFFLYGDISVIFVLVMLLFYGDIRSLIIFDDALMPEFYQ